MDTKITIENRFVGLFNFTLIGKKVSNTLYLNCAKFLPQECVPRPVHHTLHSGWWAQKAQNGYRSQQTGVGKFEERLYEHNGKLNGEL